MPSCSAGYVTEATEWREWLLRAAAGMPAGSGSCTASARRASSPRIRGCPGFPGSRVRSPFASGTRRTSSFSSTCSARSPTPCFQARRMGIAPYPWAWSLEKTLLEGLERRWHEPDHGIWEVRGPRRHFTHSKVMAWVAFDRGDSRSVERFGLEGLSANHWRIMRDEIHAEVCSRGFEQRRQAFTQSYQDAGLDAALLLIPRRGFSSRRRPPGRGDGGGGRA